VLHAGAPPASKDPLAIAHVQWIMGKVANINISIMFIAP